MDIRGELGLMWFIALGLAGFVVASFTMHFIMLFCDSIAIAKIQGLSGIIQVGSFTLSGIAGFIVGFIQGKP